MKKTVMLLLTLGLAQAIFCQQSTTKKLDELMQAYCKVNKFNGSVLVSQKGKTLLQKGYGIKNAASQTMNDANSIFQIYSITKTFTSTMILKLAEMKKLSVSDKLSRFYPELSFADSVTIEQLLSHTAGIYDGDNIPDKTEASLVGFLKSKQLDFIPGTQWRYSNTGYRLLGYIIQKITGITYEKAIAKYIFKPLQMTHSGFDFKFLSSPNKTTGYEVFNDDIKKEAIVYDPPGPFAAGAIYSTVGDLYKFHQALQTYKILNKASLDKACSEIKNNYGFGWMINSIEGKKIVSHSGGAAGYRSNFMRIPKDDICIILLNNTENANVERITKSLLNVIINMPYKIPSEVKLSKAVLKRYTGTYQATGHPMVMYVSIENGRLVAQPQGQQKSILLAEKENYFYSEEVDGYLEFPADEKAEYNDLIIHQGGQSMGGKRIHPSWGLIGNATSKGWEENIPDIQLTEDSTMKDRWYLHNIKLDNGEFKFRFNNDWNINYGDSGNDQLLDLFGENIKIAAGMYDILLDLSNEAKPVYSIIKKD